MLTVLTCDADGLKDDVHTNEGHPHRLPGAVPALARFEFKRRGGPARGRATDGRNGRSAQLVISVQVSEQMQRFSARTSELHASSRQMSHQNACCTCAACAGLVTMVGGDTKSAVLQVTLFAPGGESVTAAPLRQEAETVEAMCKDSLTARPAPALLLRGAQGAHHTLLRRSVQHSAWRPSVKCKPHRACASCNPILQARHSISAVHCCSKAGQGTRSTDEIDREFVLLNILSTSP